MKNILNFLAKLEQNNNREWFQTNKSQYTQAQQQLGLITEMLINEVKQFDSSIAYVQPKDCIFRIYRDVRFSHDKRPYKNHFGSYIAPDGRKSIFPGYYLHIQTGASFVAGGLHCPDKDILQAVRQEIASNGDEFLEIINEPEFKKYFPEMVGEKLKTAPKGFDKEHQYIDLLRYKSFDFFHPLSDSELLSGEFMEKSLRAFEEAYKINRLFRDIILEYRS
ncbi:MAG: DUF2461 domain-containing protein [Mangrovibacterium sp.]